MDNEHNSFVHNFEFKIINYAEIISTSQRVFNWRPITKRKNYPLNKLSIIIR